MPRVPGSAEADNCSCMKTAPADTLHVRDAASAYYLGTLGAWSVGTSREGSALRITATSHCPSLSPRWEVTPSSCGFRGPSALLQALNVVTSGWRR